MPLAHRSLPFLLAQVGSTAGAACSDNAPAPGPEAAPMRSWLRSSPDPTQAPMFWDNRTRSLESQARGRLTTAIEMRGAAFDETTIFPELAKRLGAIPEYVTRFDAAFGSPNIDETRSDGR